MLECCLNPAAATPEQVCLQIYKRLSLGKKSESYRLVQTFDHKPNSREMTPLFTDGY